MEKEQTLKWANNTEICAKCLKSIPKEEQNHHHHLGCYPHYSNEFNGTVDDFYFCYKCWEEIKNKLKINLYEQP